MILNNHFFEERETEKNLKEGLVWILLWEVYASLGVMKAGGGVEELQNQRRGDPRFGLLSEEEPFYLAILAKVDTHFRAQEVSSS